MKEQLLTTQNITCNIHLYHLFLQNHSWKVMALNTHKIAVLVLFNEKQSLLIRHSPSSSGSYTVKK